MISLRMAGAVFSLLLFLLLSGILASVAVHSKACGADHIAYSSCNDLEFFYINGNLVDKVLFCKVLKFHYANHCDLEGYFESDYCGLDLPLANLSFKTGRKLLQRVTREEPKTHDVGQNIRPTEEKNDPGSLSTPKRVGIAASGVFFLSCALLCPCFYRKRKATAHTVLSKEPNSMDSVSSFDVISTSEKIPPSPMRVPPSPSRFTMSPKLSRIGSVHLNMNQVVKATHNFSPSLRIGEGGFGTVYKAQLEDGQVVAIKRAKKVYEVKWSFTSPFAVVISSLRKGFILKG